jgi:hypothetical protein
MMLTPVCLLPACSCRLLVHLQSRVRAVELRFFALASSRWPIPTAEKTSEIHVPVDSEIAAVRPERAIRALLLL